MARASNHRFQKHLPKKTTMTNTQVVNMQRFMEEFRILQSVRNAEQLKRMAVFLSGFSQAYQPLLAQQGEVFNVFSLLRIGTDEVIHSSFLAWLLDPNGTHCQGGMFLEAFSELCGLSHDLSSPRRILVRAEYSGLEAVVDIAVLCHGEFLLYIENKILADEGPHQVEREYRDMRLIGKALQVPEKSQFAVFLTPNGRRPKSGSPEPWIPISYGEVARAFHSLLPGILSAKTRYLVSDWVNAISLFGSAS